MLCSAQMTQPCAYHCGTANTGRCRCAGRDFSQVPHDVGTLTKCGPPCLFFSPRCGSSYKYLICSRQCLTSPGTWLTTMLALTLFALGLTAALHVPGAVAEDVAPYAVCTAKKTKQTNKQNKTMHIEEISIWACLPVLLRRKIESERF